MHATAFVLLVVGIGAQVLRPLAPDLGRAAPPETAFDPSYLALAASYRWPLYIAAFAVLLVRVGAAAAVALTPWGRRVVAGIVARVGQHRPARAAAAVVTTVVVAIDLLVLPVVFWAGFVHDGNYGLRAQGLAGWFSDWAVYHVPVWLGVGLLTLVGYRLPVWWPRVWAPVAGIGAGLVAGILAFASPLLLEPLMFSFEPLAPGPVRTEVERVLAAAGEEVRGVVVADASRQSSRQNAYISGLGSSERVVLYDTLVEARPPDEVGMILAHEIAHKHNADVARFVGLSLAGGIAAAYVVAAVVHRRTTAGLQTGPADPRAAGVVLLTVVLLGVVSTPVQSFVSRRAEAAADLGSLAFTDAPDVFARMQQGVARANLSQPSPPAVVTWWWGTHPPTMARLTMARWWEQR